MGFKENLKSELEYKGMMVKELAHKSGIKKQTLDNYLSTHNSIPNAELAVKIAQALDTTVEFLITGKKIEDFQKNKSPELTEVIQRFKNLSSDKQQTILQILRFL